MKLLPMPAKSLIKRITMWAYCRNLISGAVVLRVFRRFQLWSA